MLYIAHHGGLPFLNLIYQNRHCISSGVIEWAKSFLNVVDILLLDWVDDGLSRTVNLDLVKWYNVSIQSDKDLERFVNQLSCDLACMSYDNRSSIDTLGVLAALIAMGAVPAAAMKHDGCHEHKRRR